MRKLHAVSLQAMAAATSLLALSMPAQAIDFSYSGFANITAGRVFSASGVDIGYPNSSTWTQCPACYVVDFSHGSVYENKWSLAPESRAGLQGTVNFTSDLSFTGQVMARTAAKESKLDLEWAFLSYNLSPKFTLQAGRKRLPLFFYSDFQDVSFAYNWVRVPPDVYGWAVVNYNGANITYRDDIGGWAVKSSAYVGQEHSKDNPIGKLERPERQDISWDNMMGIDLELNRDWFTARFSYNKSKQRSVAHLPEGEVQTSPDPAVYGKSSPQSFSSASFNIDLDNWIGRSEFSRVTRTPARGSYQGFLIGGGYRLGKFLPMVTYTQLKAYSSGDDSTHVETDSNISLTLRYQLNDSSSLKLQVDRSNWDYLNGTSTMRKLVTVSYDLIF
ncbi:porin [Paucibacter sp. Y2R2-4]|uniref:porin n=1 Tax=Paucibacter sp. Y2R2-4 TaxID=2893553 RepID=UPI0021E390BA|nr:porin [Paucibacter sp. Y2R2-4]MCV2351274.1 porin [Paucibacter sp. Y2R2-4]